MEIMGNSVSRSVSEPAHPILICPDFSPAASVDSFAKCTQLARHWPSPKKVFFAIPGFASKLAQHRIRDAGYSTVTVKAAKSRLDEIRNLQSMQIDLRPVATLVDRKSGGPAVGAFQNSYSQTIWLHDKEIALQPEFFVASEAEHSHRLTEKKIVKTAKRVVVIVENPVEADQAGELLKSLDQQIANQLSIDVCCHFPGQREKLSDAASESKHSVKIHRNISRLHSLMPGFDLAISNLGPAFLKLAFYRIPTIATFGFDDSMALYSKMKEFEAAISVSTNRGIGELTTAIRGLLRNQTLRQRLSDAASQLVDGDGARRVIDLVTTCKSTLKKAS